MGITFEVLFGFQIRKVFEGFADLSKVYEKTCQHTAGWRILTAS